jgi:cation-transporting ATPase 13A2
LGLVIKTAYVTTKGSLVRDIIYPRANKFKFYRDSMIFIACMSMLSLVGFAACIKSLIDAYTPTSDIVTGFLDLVTITVPPILPSCMTVGTLYAIGRLKKQKIFCISPPRINVAGRVSTMVFDKTGTLTEDCLQVYGYRGIEQSHNDKNATVFGDF